METPALDDIDHVIIGRLVTHGRESFRELAATVGLGPSATAERVRRLEREGIITGYRAVVDPAALGKDLRAVVDVRLGPDADHDRFEAELREVPDVDMAAHLTGPFDYLVHVCCEGVPALDALVRGWNRRYGGETSTRILLSVVDLAR